MKRVLLIVGCLFLLAACDTGNAAPEATATKAKSTRTATARAKATVAPKATARPKPTKTPKPAASRCVDVSQGLIDAIATGILPDTGATIVAAKAVRSKDYAKVWFVAVALDGPGLDPSDTIAVFGTNSLDPGGGLIMAVGGFAHEFTDWGHGEGTDAHMSINDDGVKQAEGCVRAAL